jgi:hypothetical protein
VDRQEYLLPRERCHAISARVSFVLLSLGESPRGNEVLHHAAFIELELVLDGICVV